MAYDAYILDGHEPVAEPDLRRWGKWMQAADRVVSETIVGRVVGTTIVGGVLVSTVFLGIDYRFDDGPPLLFETIVFDGEHDMAMERYSTWEEAEAGHAAMVAKIKRAPALKPEHPAGDSEVAT